MSAAFSFDRGFQIGILALMTQRYDFLQLVSEVIEPSAFEDAILIWFFNTIKSHQKQYNECPSQQAVANELIKACASKQIKASEVNLYREILDQLSNQIQSQNYVMDEVVRFARRQAGRKVYLETAKVMDKATEDDWDTILEKIGDARNIGVNYLDVGSWYFQTAKERAVRRQQIYAGKMSYTGITGIYPRTGDVADLDYIIGGGLKEGQLGLFLGGTGQGKSLGLNHVGKRAVVQGQRVLHYTLELSTQQTEDRYDSSWGDIEHRELNSNSAKVIDIIEQKSQAGSGDKLLIKFFPTGSATVNTLRNHVRQLAAQNWFPDVILVDYLDLLKPLTNYNDQYQDLGAITRDLRGLAGELLIPIWSATQVNRPGLNQEIVDVEHIGDSLQKAQIADIILAICRTREERQASTMRIFVAKNRNGPEKVEIAINTAYEKMSFYAGPAPFLNPSAKKGASTSQTVPSLNSLKKS